MVAIDMSLVGQMIGEGRYPVILTKASEKAVNTPNRKGVSISLQATIKGSDTEWEGRPLFRNFFYNQAPDADNGAMLFYLQQSLLAFGADEEDVSAPDMDPVAVAQSLYGNPAMATVVHNVDKNNPEKKYVNATFEPSDL